MAGEKHFTEKEEKENDKEEEEGSQTLASALQELPLIRPQFQHNCC